MKNMLYRLIIAASLPLILQTASADVLLTDNFMVTSNSQDVNQELAGRQAGPLAPARYTGVQIHHQVGNTTTDVGQPGAPANGNYVLLAFDGCFFSNLPIDELATGPITVEFDMYVGGTSSPSTDPTSWAACCLTHPDGSHFFPVVPTAGEFGFLARNNGGMQVFQNNGSITPGGWDTPGFAPSSHWTLIFSDTAGTGSAFNGNGSQVTMINGTNTLGTIALSQLDSAGLRIGWRDGGNRFGGISNFKISGTPSGITPGQNLSFEYDTALPGTAIQSIPASWTAFNENGWDSIGTQNAGGSDYATFTPLAAPAAGNQYLYVNMFSGNPTGGVYQDMGPLKTNSIYTLTVAIGNRNDTPPNGQASWSPGIISLVNGTDNTGTVLATGGGVPSTQNTWQDYTATVTTGPTVSGDLTVMLSVVGAASIQADFDNVRLDVQTLSFPPPFLVSNTSPASATVALSNNVAFTASFSNSPSVTLQWQQLVSGVTNNINAGVVTVTNNQVVTSTLTLTNVQLASAGSYRLRAVNQAGTAVYTLPAPFTVVPTITWYAAGTYNSTFMDNTVLGLAGTVANEAYGVDFGGSGFQTTANGYIFDDYGSSGNMSVVSGGLNIFGGYLVGGATTGDGALDIMLANGVFGSAANTATLNNLTIGQAYTVLVLLDDTRSSPGGPNFQVTDGVTTSPVQRYAFVNGSPAVGGYIMGTFTAQSTSQPLTVINGGSSQYNAILLEKGIAPPPPIPPTLTADLLPPVLKVTTGGTVNLSVGASGSLPLSYQWYNQGGPIGGATGTNYSFSAVDGTSSYQVVVTNSFGSVTSAVAQVVSSTNIVTVNNFSFEAGTTGSGNIVIPTSWVPFNNNNFSVVANNSYSVVNPLAAPADGNNFYAINEGPGDPTGGLYQDVGPLLANTTYTLTVAIGRRQDFPNPPGTLGSPGIIALINGTNNTGTVLVTTNGIPATADTWQDYTVTYITGDTVSGDLIVALSVAGANTFQANFDNVRLAKAPAPAIIPPSITKDIQLLRSELATGAPLTLSVEARGSLPLHFQWYNQSGPIGGATGSNYTFNAVSGTSSYYVTVSNAAPDGVVSSTAVVISDPSFVTVNNFSFENGTTGSGFHVVPAAWTDFNDGNFSTVAGGYGVMPDGNEFFAINEGPGDPTGGIYQDVGPLLPNTTYTLTVALGRGPSFGPGSGLGSPGIIQLINGASNTGTLLAGTNGIPDPAGTWQDYGATFTTGASVSGDLTIKLSVIGASTFQANFDDVRLVKAALFQFAPPKVSGGNLILTGAGGTAGAGYTLLTTTNLADPGSWTPGGSGTFDGAGAFSNSIPLGAAPARFYRVSVP
ncbi:MAG TPA: immunoglobulin domain-containing protein [Candidatus Acidoferrales bacterium]|nr:immunoglobulin domain-containing protein [Candidatus Acidoferrales bacterium]